MSMTNLLSDRSIKTKLLLILLLPLLGLLYFSGVTVLSKSHTVDNLHALQSMIHLAVKNSAAIHELQKERGLSAGFISSRGEKFASELASQRAATDQNIAGLKSFLGSFDTAHFSADFKRSLDSAFSRTEKISEMRNAISSLGVAPKDSFDYYTGLVDSLLDVTVSISKVSNDDEIVRATISYFMFLNGKERAGRERATLNGVFTANRFDPQTLQRCISLISSEDTYFSLFAAYAPSEVLPFYQEKMAGDYSSEVNAMRKIALDRGLDKISEGDFGVEPSRWFGAMTTKINAMKDVEDKLSAELDSIVSHEIGQAQRQLWLSAGFTITVIALTLLLSYLVSNNILRPMRNLHSTMMRLRESDDLKLRSDVEGRDEIGQMASAFNGMIGNFQEIVGTINRNAQQVASASAQLASAAEQVTQGSHAQSEAVSASAAAIEQLTVSASSVADSANDVSHFSQDTLSRTEQGNQSLSELFGAIDVAERAVSSIAGSVDEFIKDATSISRLTQEVRDIAEQTNLLALNAAIEAARAGDQGRGFAVVADEVRKLAEKSAKSANEIDVVTRAVSQHSEVVESTVQEGVNSLQTSQKAAENVGMVMSEAGKSVGNTTDGIGNITSAVKEQEAATTEIARNVESIAQMVEENSLAVESVSSAAMNLQNLSASLQETVGKFRY